MTKIHCPSFVFTNPQKRSPSAAAKHHPGSSDLLITMSRMLVLCGEIKIPAWLKYLLHSQFIIGIPIFDEQHFARVEKKFQNLQT